MYVQACCIIASVARPDGAAMDTPFSSSFFLSADMPPKRDKPVEIQHPPPITAEAYVRATLLKQIDELVMSLRTIDAAITQANWLLERRQPFQSGRLSVQWLQKSGQIRPQVVVWQRMRLSKEWRYLRVAPVGLSRRLKRARLFKDNFPLNVELITLVQDLIEKRRAILNSVTEFNHASNLRLISAGTWAEEFTPRLGELMTDKDNPAYQWFDPDDPIDWNVDHDDN